MNSQPSSSTAPPLVTVVLPTLNRPHYLAEALQSALNQTYQNLEILIRDNASEAATRELVESFHDPRIRYTRHPENIGMTANVLGGFREARGTYVTNLHDDDFWEPRFIATLVEKLEGNKEAALAFSDHYIVDSDGVILKSHTEKSTSLFGRLAIAAGLHQPFQDLALIKLSVPMAMASLVRRSAIDWEDFPNFTCAYDFWLVYLACRDGGACYYHPERLSSYRIHATSESNLGRIRLNTGFIEIYEGMLKDERVKQYHAVFRKRLASHFSEKAVALLRKGDRTEARRASARGLHYRLDAKACAAYAGSYLPSQISRKLPKKLRFPALLTALQLHALGCHFL